jgi:hypothetical protein
MKLGLTLKFLSGVGLAAELELGLVASILKTWESQPAAQLQYCSMRQVEVKDIYQSDSCRFGWWSDTILKMIMNYHYHVWHHNCHIWSQDRLFDTVITAEPNS